MDEGDELGGVERLAEVPVVDVEEVVDDIENLFLESFTPSTVTNQVHIGQKLHFNLDCPFALALVASASVHIEGKVCRIESLVFCQGLVSKQFSDLVVGFQISYRIGSGRFPYWVLVNQLYVFNKFFST